MKKEKGKKILVAYEYTENGSTPRTGWDYIHSTTTPPGYYAGILTILKRNLKRNPARQGREATKVLHVYNCPQ